MNTFGEISWSDDINFGSDKKKEANKDVWLRLDEGSNVVRLLTQPHQYTVHRGIKKEGEKGYGRRFTCAKPNGSCTLCDQDYKTTQRWLLGVLDRKSGAYRVLDIPYQVFSQIRKLARKVDVWGDPTKYDIDIVVDRNGGPTGYYSVQPIPHKPLTAQEQSVRDNAPLEYLKEKIQPLSSEVLQKILDKFQGGVPLAKPQKDPIKAGAKTNVQSAESDMTDEETLDEIFPAHDGN